MEPRQVDVMGGVLQADGTKAGGPSPSKLRPMKRSTVPPGRAAERTWRQAGRGLPANHVQRNDINPRARLGRLAQNSELYNRYVRKLDQQETEIDKVRKDIETLKGTEEQQRKELNDYLMGLDIS